MTLGELEDVTASWRKSPPLAVMVAHYLGFTTEKPAAPATATPDDLAEFEAVARSAGVR